jgi:hypothetical protein
VEVWRAKDVLAVAKELTVLADKNELQGHGLIWKDQTAHEEGIKVCILLALLLFVWLPLSEM